MFLFTRINMQKKKSEIQIFVYNIAMASFIVFMPNITLSTMLLHVVIESSNVGIVYGRL